MNRFQYAQLEPGPVEDLGVIEFLEAKIARLEEELRLRDEVDFAPEPEHPFEPDSVRAEMIRSFQAEITDRDEMIEILQEHVRILEEAREADRQEWEQIGQWVEQLEAQAAPGSPIPDSALIEQDRTWRIERSALQTEISQLQARLSERAAVPTTREADALRTELRATQLEVERLRQLALNTTVIAEVDALSVEPIVTAGPRAALTPNERLRALRMHLNEIQQREEQERRERSLAARLSRIWNRTSSSA